MVNIKKYLRIDAMFKLSVVEDDGEKVYYDPVDDKKVNIGSAGLVEIPVLFSKYTRSDGKIYYRPHKKLNNILSEIKEAISICIGEKILEIKKELPELRIKEIVYPFEHDQNAVPGDEF